MSEFVYIAGPIKGRHDDNRAAFASAAAALTRRGFTPINPHHVDPVDHAGDCPPMGYQPGLHTQGHTSSCCFMRTDITALLGCDLIFLLPGWEDSKGASLEAAVAEGVGIPRIYLGEGNERCSLCGCTNDNACLTQDGPCHWAAAEICSSCWVDPDAAPDGEGGES